MNPAPLPTDRAALLAQLDAPRRYDLAVVGGGATGLGVALDAALEPVSARRGQAAQCFHAPEELRRAQASLARQRVIHLQADAVERRLPQLVRGHDEGQRLRQVRRAVEDVHALVQRLAHQVDVALRQVAHAAVHPFRGARRGALGEIVRLHQHHAVAALRCVQRDAQAGGAAADHGQVELARLGQAGQQGGAVGGEGGSGHGRICSLINSYPRLLVKR